MQYKKIKIKENKSNNNSNNLLEKLLNQRNLNNENEIKKFLTPSKDDFLSPYLFSDMKKAKDRIFKAIENEEKILIWGDFDCDGATSTSILYKTLTELKSKVIKFIPDRLLHGHGLNSKELLKLISKEKIRLVITVDCGTSNIAEVNLLKGLKIDTIITDHHSTNGQIPDAFAIINAQIPDAIDKNTNIETIQSMSYNSGSIVAYKLAMALLEDSNNEQLKEELLIIAACGAIADVVPILGENRSIVSIALDILNSKKENSSYPIYKLLSRNINDRNITSTDIAFILAPRINAVGRLANAELSFEFLTSKSEARIEFIISELDNYNSIRQAKCKEVYEEILDYLKQHKEEENNPAIILINKNWHIGVIGIVAAKIVEQYNKPCFLMTVDENNNARCSIRSNDVINVYDILAQNAELFLGFGGHKLAGGCSFDLNTNNFEKIKNSILETIKISLEDKQLEEDILFADIELEKDDINLELIETINQLEPFGEGNPSPLCVLYDVNLDSCNTIGKEKKHLKLIFSKDGTEFTSFKWNESEVLIPINSKCDIAFYPKLNSFNGINSVQLELVNIYSENILKTKKPSSNTIKIYDHRLKTGILEQISSYLSNKSLNIGIWAKTPKTKEMLSKYENIKNNFIQNNTHYETVMFFDYPSSNNELIEIISTIKPSKFHLMNYKIDENIENYIKQLSGMIKYCSSKLNGDFDITKISQAVGVNEEFIQISIEILDNIEAIKILDINKIKYLQAFNYEKFKYDTLFEILIEEFKKTIEFKKTLLNCSIEEFKSVLENI